MAIANTELEQHRLELEIRSKLRIRLEECKTILDQVERAAGKHRNDQTPRLSPLLPQIISWTNLVCDNLRDTPWLEEFDVNLRPELLPAHYEEIYDYLMKSAKRVCNIQQDDIDVHWMHKE